MKYEIDFMPVGNSNGDAICTRHGTDLFGYEINIIDGGYTEVGQKILDHLDSVYKKTDVQNLILTHADDDHARGLLTVLENCKVNALRMNRPWNFAAEALPSFHGNYSLKGLINAMRDLHPMLVELEDMALSKGIKISDTFAGNTFGPITVLSPTKELYVQLIPDMDKTPDNYKDQSIFGGIVEQAGKALSNVAENWGMETLEANPPPTSSSNESSIVQMFTCGNYRALFTADAGPIALGTAHHSAKQLQIPTQPNLLQVPHQGSRRNVTPAVLDAWLGARLGTSFQRGHAYCTVGKNKTDHPRKKVANAFARRGYPVTVGRESVVCFSEDLRHGWSKMAPLPFFDFVEG